MKKTQLLLSAILLLIGTGAANAQKAYTYVQQNGAKIDKLGTAAFDLSDGSHPTVEFDENGKAVMKIGNNTVAALPMSDKGQLVVEFEATVPEADLNKVTKTYSNDYATLYSPFQLIVPASSTVEVYAPTYDATSHVVKCNSTTQIAAGAVIPAEKALLLKNAGSIEFTISAGAATDTHVSALSGSSLMIDVPSVADGNTLYTLGHETTTNEYGFFLYTGSKLNPGLAWLVADPLSANAAKYIPFSFDDDDVTAVSGLEAETSQRRDGKFIENDRVVIIKNGKKYNLNGQEVK